ncbi:MAG: hypothetical protein J1D77_02670 [Muribaculaceae bacterium]|nr:hypothetical protein [Muribaculaceae bacterium]
MKASLNKIYLSGALLSLALMGCNDEGESIRPGGELTDPITFMGYEVSSHDLSTRAEVSNLISREYFNTKFYMERLVLREDESNIESTDYDQDLKACGVYIIPKGTDGILTGYGEKERLKWATAKNFHRFVGWTTPWLEDRLMGPEENDYSINYDPFIDESSEDYLKDGTYISFDENDGMYAELDDNENCKVLEAFIGSSHDIAVKYDDYREHVPMRFRHLVSKIIISKLTFTTMDADGTITNKKVDKGKGKITFINLPSSGLFYREEPTWPLVKPNPKGKNEVTYNIYEGAELYVCPNVDFSNVQFRISAEGISEFGDFLGDFKNVEFVRETNSWDLWYKNHYPDLDLAHTLCFGETMTMSINLRQGKGYYVSVSINDWNTQDVREASAYPHPGIYKSSDLTDDFYNTFANGYTPELEEMMFQKYGDEEDNKYHLYSDVTVKLCLRMGVEHVTNGMGYTVTFENTYGGKVRISKIYDVYLTDGNNTIYIDKDFKIYTVDKNGNETFTGKILGEPEDLGGENVCFLLDLSNGNYTLDKKLSS